MQDAGDLDRLATLTNFRDATMSANAPIILVVEDDAIVRMLIVDVLEELEFKVLEADGCEQALDFLNDEDQHIDLMMTDVGLPVMDGRELASRRACCAMNCRCCLPAVMPKASKRPKACM